MGALRPSTDADPMRQPWRHFFTLTASFFVSNQWKIAWPMLIALIALAFGGTYSIYLVGMWEKALFDALEGRRADAFLGLIAQFFVIAALTTVVPVVRGYLQQMLALRWRAWLTADYQERWLRDNRFLDIERRNTLDNPDQRIAEDLSQFSAQLLALVLNFLGAASSIVTFGILLAASSRPIRLPGGVSLPYDMLIYAVLYAVLGAWVIVRLGKPLVGRTARQQHVEADYRFRLVNIRRNAEQVAFSRAGSTEWRKLNEAFAAIFTNFRQLTIAQQIVGAGSNIYFSIQNVLPIFLALPRYFGGGMSLGDVTLARTSFGQFSAALSWFVQSYPTIAVLTAIVRRIRELDAAIAQPTPAGISVTRVQDDALTAGALRLDLPDGTELARIPHWRVNAGERWRIKGASGAGKSTLLRAMAAIWPSGAGTITVPGAPDAMFLPQRAYLPIGTLKEAMCFPAAPAAFSDEACVAVLDQLRLGEKAVDLHHERRWSELLSPGEQQRLALARVLLHRPAYLFLDEATSALDPDNAAHAYRILLAALPGVTIVSVVHDPALDPFHDHELSITGGVAHCSDCPR